MCEVIRHILFARATKFPSIFHQHICCCFYPIAGGFTFVVNEVIIILFALNSGGFASKFEDT